MNKRSSKDSRQNIIDAAQRVFLLHGYAGSTMRMIAEQAGISVGGIYLYFKNKEELCLLLIDERLKEFSEKIDIALKKIDDPVDALREYILLSIEYAKRHNEFIITQSREKGFTFGIDIKREFFKRQKEVIKGIIEKGIKKGIFVNCNIEEATRIVMGIIRGFVLSLVVDPDNLFDAGHCSELILSGLLSRSS